MCSAVTCPLHFWQNDRDLFSFYCGKTGMERKVKKEKEKKKKESAQKLYPGEEHSPAAPAGTRTRDLSIKSPAL